MTAPARWNPRNYRELANFLEHLLVDAEREDLWAQRPEDRISETERLIGELKDWLSSHANLVTDRIAARLVQRTAALITEGSIPGGDEELINILVTLTEREHFEWPLQSDWLEYHDLIESFTERDENGVLLSRPVERAESVFADPTVAFNPAGARVAVSGRFAFGEQSTVLERLAELGAEPQDAVDRSTTVLILGLTSAFADGTVYRTRKLERVFAHRAEGSVITVLHEVDVIDMLAS